MALESLSGAQRGALWTLTGIALTILAMLMNSMVRDARTHEAAVPTRDRYEEKVHGDKCIELRTAFFAGCKDEGVGYTQCQVAWSQVRGQVLDAPPNNPWAAAVDCSR